MRHLNLALALVAVCSASGQFYMSNSSKWPVFGGSLEIDEPTIGIPSALDRALLFYMSLFRWSANNIYAGENSDLIDSIPGISITNVGAITNGYNTARMTRAHAADRKNCPSSLSSVLVPSSELLSCNLSTAVARYGNWLWDAGNNVSFEVAVSRQGFSSLHYLEAARIAVSDMVCGSTWNASKSKWNTCENSQRTSFFLTFGEASCGGEVSDTGYAASCVFTTVADPAAPSTYTIANGHRMASASHIKNSDGLLEFIAVTNYVSGKQTVKIQWANLSTTDMASSLDDYSTAGAFKLTTNLVVANMNDSDCIAYRIIFCDKVSSLTSCSYYPGGPIASSASSPSPQGWLKTYGLGKCRQNYCQCLEHEGTTLNECCAEDCYYAKSTVCANSSNSCMQESKCTGSSATCPTVQPKANGTLCGTTDGGISLDCDGADTCDGNGTCLKNIWANGTSCGNLTATQCDLPDTCLSGLCLTNLKQNGTLCGDIETRDICHSSDTCQNGFCISGTQNEDALCNQGNQTCSFETCVQGYCIQHNKSSSVLCGSPPFDVDGSCWSAFYCSGGSCFEAWKPSTTICNAANSLLPCDTDDHCTGFNQTCLSEWKPSSDICRNSSDGVCDPAEFCTGLDGNCPSDQKCQNCTLLQSSLLCEESSVPSGSFYGCKWSGSQWGCYPKKNITDNEVTDEILTCGEHYPLSSSIQYYNTSEWDNITETYKGDLEVVTLVSVTDNYAVTKICGVVKIVSNNDESIELGSQYVYISAVFYNVDENSLPDNLKYQTAAMPFYISDRGLLQVSFNLTYPNVDHGWGIMANESAFVGLRIENSAPAISLFGQYSPDKMITLYRNPHNNQSNWTDASETMDASIIVDLTSGSCGDKFVSFSEDCDSNTFGSFCTQCHCWNDSSINIESNGCKCNWALPSTLDGHQFVAPPTLALSFSDDVAHVLVTVPQTDPFRWDAAAELVNAKTGDVVSMTEDERVLSMESYPCFFKGSKMWEIGYLVRNGFPRAVEHDIYWEIQFAILVSWNETVQLRTRVPNVTRGVHSRLTFELIIQKELMVNSTITVIDSSVLWAYIRRGFLVVPESSDPYFEVELETLAKSDGIIIDSTSFTQQAVFGHVKSIGNISMLSQTEDRFQIWSFRIFFDSMALCTLSNFDNFTLSYVLTSLSTEVSPSVQQMSFQIATSENWCASQANISVQLRADQYTYSDSTFTHKAIKFLRGSWMYVMVNVSEVYSILPSSVSLSHVSVWGSATTFSPDHRTIWNITFNDSNWGVSIIDCPSTLGNQMCYTMKLPTDQLAEKQPLYIQSIVELEFSNRRTASVQMPVQQAEASSRIILQLPSPATPQDKTGQNTVIVYRVTPAFLAASGTLALISLLSILSTFWVVRYRDTQA